MPGGVDSASKNECQDIPGGKGGRCVEVTTLPPSCAECLLIWSLNILDPSGPRGPVMGILYVTVSHLTVGTNLTDNLFSDYFFHVNYHILTLFAAINVSPLLQAMSPIASLVTPDPVHLSSPILLHFSPKRRCLSTETHGVSLQKTARLILRCWERTNVSFYLCVW